MGHRYLILLTFFALTGCAHCGPMDPEDPDRPPPAPDTPADCSTACDNLRRLECPEGDPTPGDGAPCEDVCNNAAQYGISLDTACVTKMSSCEQIEDCAGE